MGGAQPLPTLPPDLSGCGRRRAVETDHPEGLETRTCRDRVWSENWVVRSIAPYLSEHHLRLRDHCHQLAVFNLWPQLTADIADSTNRIITFCCFTHRLNNTYQVYGIIKSMILPLPKNNPLPFETINVEFPKVTIPA